jgi:tyrosyl-tRNA synthetase
MKNLKEQLEVIKKGAVEIIPEDGLVNKLKRSIETNKPLKIKLGLDPSSPDIHLGHTVVLQKLRDFQKLGHIVQLIIGDFTGMIGDPTGKSATRKQLTKKEVEENAKTYKEQIFKILDPEKTEVYFNSKWLSKLNFEEIIKLSSHVTVSQMLQRNDFQKRYNEQQPISLHEFFYPLMQGYDSVALETDIELGGTDQTFNLMMGRELQKSLNSEGQIAITMPIIEGLDGVQKMSKSLNNYIGVLDAPNEMYGKVMSIPDDLILKYFTLLTDAEDLSEIKKELTEGNPRDVKMKLAKMLVERFHNEETSINAEIHFVETFQKREIPADIPVVSIVESEVWIVELLQLLQFTDSKSEARRKIKEGAVKINGEKIEDEKIHVTVDNAVIQLGRRKMAKLKKAE